MRRYLTFTPHVARLALAALLLAAFAVAAPASAEVTIAADDERPLRGEVVRLRVEHDGAPAAGYRLVAQYRPNSQTGYAEELVAVDASGSVMWTPQEAGPATLEAWPPDADPDGGGSPAAELTVAVRYGGFPPSGLIIMILAGLLLFGGAASAMVLLLRPDRDPPPEPPST